MMRRGTGIIFALLLAFQVPPLYAAEFDAEMLRSVHKRVTPAIGLVEYTSETRSRRSGQTSRRSNTTMGIVVSPDGLVMTRGHVVIDDVELFNVTVTLGEGKTEKKYDADVLRKPDDLNVVFLRLKSEEKLNLPYVRFAKSSTLALGQRVALFGILGEPLDHSRAFWEARVAAYLDTPRPTYCLDGAIPFGFVSGPVVNTGGEVIGVVGFDLSSAEGGEVYTRSGHPLVYQIELFRKYLEKPPAKDDVAAEEEDAYLGVFSQPLTDDLAAYWDMPADGGLVVSTVVSASPAARAGFEAGDIIKRFNDIVIAAKQDRDVLGFTKLVREAGIGRDVQVEILRDGETMQLSVVLEPRPITARDAEEYEDEAFGLTVRALTRDVRISLNISDDLEGVIVSQVRSGGTAQLGRVFPGVIIIEFGGMPVKSIEDFKAAVARVTEEKPSEVPVFARAGASTGFFRLEPRWATP